MKEPYRPPYVLTREELERENAMLRAELRDVLYRANVQHLRVGQVIARMQGDLDAAHATGHRNDAVMLGVFATAAVLILSYVVQAVIR